MKGKKTNKKRKEKKKIMKTKKLKTIRGNYKLVSLAALGGLCVLAACGKSVNSKNAPKKEIPVQKPISVPMPQKPDPIAMGKVLLHELEKANEFEVELKWQVHPEAHSYLIKRSLEGASDWEQIAVVEANFDHFIDDVVSPGLSYQYEVTALLKSTSVIILNDRVKVPMDFMLPANASDLQIANLLFNSTKTFNRVFLPKNKIVKTSGKKTVLSAKEIIADNSTIVHESVPNVAANGRNGAQVPSFTLNADAAKGKLTVITRGQRGGQGPAQAKRPAANPNRGKKGRDAAISLIECLRNAENGGRGPRGSKGVRGHSGMNGGSSPVLMVNIKESSRLLLDFDLQPGVGGLGGPGGLGGLGGRGGAPGSRRGYCQRKAKEGPRGLVGLSGDRGVIGKAGVVAPYCILLNNYRVQGNCKATNDALEKEAIEKK